MVVVKGLIRHSYNTQQKASRDNHKGCSENELISASNRGVYLYIYAILVYGNYNIEQI